jgi:hypothetical protein
MECKTWCHRGARLRGLSLVLLLKAAAACAQPESPASSQAVTPAPVKAVPSPNPDEDKDTIPDALEKQLAERLFPMQVYSSAGEACLSPAAWKKVNSPGRPGVVVYRVFKHPENAEALALIYAFLYEEDCSAPTGVQHTGDVEGLGYTLVKDPRCGEPGWRIAKARTRFFQGGAIQIDEWQPPQQDPCGPLPALFITMNQHSNVLNEAKCRGSAKVGAGHCGRTGPEVMFVQHNAGEPDSHASPAFRDALAPEFPNERVWGGQSPSARFCGGRRCTANEPCTGTCCRDDASSSPCTASHVLQDMELLAAP